uniref:hypothetical protein n=1 Tax=Alistipes sp. TaxID=1872444 RepID=UPI00405763FA
MKNGLKIYLKVLLWGLGLLLLLFALSVALGYGRENKLNNATKREALERELGIELPDYREIPAKYDYDGYRAYELFFEEPLSSEQMRLIEERCDDPKSPYWSYWKQDDRYSYERENLIWGYTLQCYIDSSEEMRVAVWEYSPTSSFSLYLIPFYLLFWGLLAWGSVIPLWGLVLLVMALVRASKRSKAEAQ